MTLPFYPFYWSDYSGKTMHLSQGEHGAYMLLMRYIYTTGKGVPDKQRYSIARATLEQEIANVESVLEQFFVLRGDVWENSTITEVMSEADEAHKRRVEAGSKGGKAKAKHSSSNAIATKAKASELKKDISIPLPLSTVHSLPDDLKGRDFNNFEEACFACLLLAGDSDGVLPQSEQQIVIGWMSEYDMNWAIPIVAAQMASYIKKNRGARPSSLAYFSKRLAERHMLEGMK